MTKSVDEQLAENEAAISAVETRGQRFTIKDREVWRADLKALDERQQRLERKVERAKAGGIRVQRIVPL
jgi:hypothetical protein